MQEVQVYVMISGDYCAFHEMSIRVVYDITNDKPIGFNDYDKEKLENWDFNDDGGDYSDVESRSAIKIGDTYYIRA
jgi:hypothetical protein